MGALLAFLLFLALVPAALTFVWPRRFFWHYLLLVAAGAALLIQLLASEPPDGPGGAIGFAVLMLVGCVLVLALGIRGAIVLARKSDPADLPFGMAERFIEFGMLFLAATAWSGWLLWTMAGDLKAIRPAIILHVGLLVLALALLGVSWLTFRRGSPGFQRFAAPVGLGGSLVLMVATGVSLSAARVVPGAAERAAQGRPYCIQIAGDGIDYLPVGAWPDFTLLSMRTDSRNGIKTQNHAVLFLEGSSGLEMLVWSYRSTGFLRLPATMNDPRRWPAMACEPRRNFAADLPLVASTHREAPPLVVMVDGRVLKIPAAYQARVMTGENTNIFLNAPAPLFAPGKPQRTRARWFDQSLQIEFAAPVEQGRPAQMLGGKSVTFQPGPYELEIRQPADGTTEYRQLSPRGHVVTAIRCYEGTPKWPPSCQHWFERDGASFSFRHSPAHLSDWRLMQDRALALLTLLEAKPSAPSPSPAQGRR